MRFVILLFAERKATARVNKFRLCVDWFAFAACVGYVLHNHFARYYLHGESISNGLKDRVRKAKYFDEINDMKATKRLCLFGRLLPKYGLLRS